jgi:hypothetical protein
MILSLAYQWQDRLEYGLGCSSAKEAAGKSTIALSSQRLLIYVDNYDVPLLVARTFDKASCSPLVRAEQPNTTTSLRRFCFSLDGFVSYVMRLIQ